MSSPLFISAIELLAHSTELFAQKNDKKNKFIILHLANAVELIIKDRLLSSGISIYIKNTNRTITLWDCFSELDKLNILISERPIIELLVDDRNTIQHRFGFPNTESVYYYLYQTTNFFKRFLLDEYNVNLKDEISLYLKKEYLDLLGLGEDENKHLNKLKDVSIPMAILTTYSQIEGEMYKIKKNYEERNSLISHQFMMPPIEVFIKFLTRNKILSEVDAIDFLKLKLIRNEIAHGLFKDDGYTNIQLKDLFDLAQKIVNAINKAKEEDFFTERKVLEFLSNFNSNYLPKENMEIKGLGKQVVFTDTRGAKFFIAANGNRVYLKKE